MAFNGNNKVYINLCVYLWNQCLGCCMGNFAYVQGFLYSLAKTQAHTYLNINT